MRVWVTRAEPEAQATAERLRGMGHQPLVAPLLSVEPVDVPLDLADVGALAFTSRNGVRAYAEREAGRDLPVYAVGDGTADAARQAGFRQVRSAAGDVAALARAVAADPNRPPGLVLHPGPAEPAGDLAAALGAEGVAARTVAIYRTSALPPSPAVLTAWPTLDAVLIHSPKAARALAEADALLPPPGPALFCISEAAAAPVRARFSPVLVAVSPDEPALLARLGNAAAPS